MRRFVDGSVVVDSALQRAYSTAASRRDVSLSQILAMPKSPFTLLARRSNALFAYDCARTSDRSNPFPNTRLVTIAARETEPIGLEIAAGDGASVEVLYDQAAGCCAYLWGQAGHPDVAKADLLQWIVRKVNAGEHAAFREIVGLFVVAIDDRRNRRVRMVCDALGLRPWFVGQHNGQLVCGSDVWAIQEAGLNSGGINYDAVASWVRHAYDCTGQSLFADFPQMGAGVVATWEKGKYSESPYADFIGNQCETPLETLLEGIHSGVSRALAAVTRELDHVSVALSGGFDSRYLAALASRRKDLKVEAFSVRDREAEALAATMAAEALGLSVHILKTDGSLWNIYDQPYHFTAGGFPMTKQHSWCAAAQRPGLPCLNGFIGDPIVRGTLDRINGKREAEIEEDLAVAYQRYQRVRHTSARFDLLDGGIVRRCDERTLATWRRHVDRWNGTGHCIFALGTFIRQRHYLSNNFLQHMDLAEAIVPFAAWEVVQHKLQNSAGVYSFATYEALFRKFFPEIANVPHNSMMGAKNEFNPRPSRCTREWAAKVLKGLSGSRCLPLLSRRKSVPRLIGALMGRRDVEVVALFLYRLYMLDERLRRAGVTFDWYAI
jgi:hypothetical protein